MLASARTQRLLTKFWSWWDRNRKIKERLKSIKYNIEGYRIVAYPPYKTYTTQRINDWETEEICGVIEYLHKKGYETKIVLADFEGLTKIRSKTQFLCISWKK